MSQNQSDFSPEAIDSKQKLFSVSDIFPQFRQDVG